MPICSSCNTPTGNRAKQYVCVLQRIQHRIKRERTQLQRQQQQREHDNNEVLETEEQNFRTMGRIKLVKQIE